MHGPTFGNAESRIFLLAEQYFSQLINAEKDVTVSQLFVNTLPATKVTLITHGI
jgi:hypothetical protein